METSEIDKRIFKTYDVRGVYPGQINDEVAEIIGIGLGKIFGKGPVVIGRDMRIGSDEIFAGLTRGLNKAGISVHDLGLAPIDFVYFAVNKLGYGGGVMITASHNPKEYNGMKIVRKRGDLLDWVRGVDLKPEIEKADLPKKAKEGEVVEKDFWPDYIEHNLSFLDRKNLKPFSIVIDAGNGMAGKVLPSLIKDLPIKVEPVFFELDGNFPNHPSNPLLPESQLVISKKVIDLKADFGVIFDGDADRLFFVDEKGEFIRADITLLFLAKVLLEKNPGAGIAYNVICSRIVKEKIIEWGGRPLRSAVGFVNVAKAMRDNGGVMGGELSGHYSFRDNGYADSGFIAFLILLELISKSEGPLSQMVAPFKKYYKGDEINLPLDSLSVERVINDLRKRYSDGRQDELDGLTVEFSDWWFNARASNTEPLLRVTIEADTKDVFDKRTEEILEFINKLRT